MERDLQFEDVQQDLWMQMKLNEQERALELQREALKNGDVAAALALNDSMAARNAEMKGREKEDLDRHQKRGDIRDFKRREETRWRP